MINRKQYLIRCLILAAVVVTAMLCFMAVPSDSAAQTAGIAFAVIVILATLYNIFGLSIPRLRSAKISLWAVLLVFIPLGIVILFVICVIAPEKS